MLPSTGDTSVAPPLIPPVTGMREYLGKLPTGESLNELGVDALNSRN
jgi:hypothetical protein